MMAPLRFFPSRPPSLKTALVDLTAAPLALPVIVRIVNIVLQLHAVKVEPIPAADALNHLPRFFATEAHSLLANAVFGRQLLHDRIWVEQHHTFQLQQRRADLFQRPRTQQLVGLRQGRLSDPL